MNSLNAKEQQELNTRMEKRQMKEFMTVWDDQDGKRLRLTNEHARCTQNWSSAASTIALTTLQPNL